MLCSSEAFQERQVSEWRHWGCKRPQYQAVTLGSCLLGSTLAEQPHGEPQDGQGKQNTGLPDAVNALWYVESTEPSDPTSIGVQRGSPVQLDTVSAGPHV